jgi:hypothetical protein
MPAPQERHGGRHRGGTVHVNSPRVRHVVWEATAELLSGALCTDANPHTAVRQQQGSGDGGGSGIGGVAYGEGGTCPCCMAFSTPSNAALNAHMDECLNRSLLDR